MLGASDRKDGRRLRQVGLPRAAARVMAACATAAELCPDLPLGDGLASSAFERLGGNPAHFDAVELRCTAFRAFVVDCLAREFFERTPGGLGVGIWSLLSTRAHRLLEFPWVDVDAPDVARLRQFVLPPRRGWLQLGACLCTPSWLEAIGASRKRKLLLVLDESVLPIAGAALTRFLDQVSTWAPTGSELVLAFDAHSPLRPASPSRGGAALEVVTREGGAEQVARYPRLRFVDGERYPPEVASSVAGVNALATLGEGRAAPGLAHLRLV